MIKPPKPTAKTSKAKAKGPNEKLRDTIAQLIAHGYKTIAQHNAKADNGVVTLADADDLSAHIHVSDWTDDTCSISMTVMVTGVNRRFAATKMREAKAQIDGIRSVLSTFNIDAMQSAVNQAAAAINARPARDCRPKARKPRKPVN